MEGLVDNLLSNDLKNGSASTYRIAEEKDIVLEFLRSSASFSGVYSPALDRCNTATGTGFFASDSSDLVWLLLRYRLH